MKKSVFILMLVTTLILTTGGICLAGGMFTIEIPYNVLPPDRIYAETLLNLGSRYEEMGWYSEEIMRSILSQVDNVLREYRNIRSFEDYQEIFGERLLQRNFNGNFAKLSEVYDRAIACEDQEKYQESFAAWHEFQRLLNDLYYTNYDYYEPDRYWGEDLYAGDEYDDYQDKPREIHLDGYLFRDYARYENLLYSIDEYLYSEGLKIEKANYDELNNISTKTMDLIHQADESWEELIALLEKVICKNYDYPESYENNPNVYDYHKASDTNNDTTADTITDTDTETEQLDRKTAEENNDTGYMLHLEGDYEGAIEAFETALSYDYTYFLPYYNYARTICVMMSEDNDDFDFYEAGIIELLYIVNELNPGYVKNIENDSAFDVMKKDFIYYMLLGYTIDNTENVKTILQELDWYIEDPLQEHHPYLGGATFDENGMVTLWYYPINFYQLFEYELHKFQGKYEVNGNKITIYLNEKMLRRRTYDDIRTNDSEYEEVNILHGYLDEDGSVIIDIFEYPLLYQYKQFGS
ncbi:MAG: hypothetical protein KAX49_00265 [Halanaerobiales bacterium]|nr:hypothetical protein [Halanaerobiales bacterium]